MDAEDILAEAQEQLPLPDDSMAEAEVADDSPVIPSRLSGVTTGEEDEEDSFPSPLTGQEKIIGQLPDGRYKLDNGDTFDANTNYTWHRPIVQDGQKIIQYTDPYGKSGFLKSAAATGSKGASATGEKLTESQSKKVEFYERAKSASERAEKLLGGYDTNSFQADWDRAVYGTSVWGRTASDKAKELYPALQEFSNAILRDESGAAIPPNEIKSAITRYFPAPGDTPEAIDQKRANRTMAIESLRTVLPETRRGDGSPAAAPAAPSGVSDQRAYERAQAILNDPSAKMESRQKAASVMKILKLKGMAP